MPRGPSIEDVPLPPDPRVEGTLTIRGPALYDLMRLLYTEVRSADGPVFINRPAASAPMPLLLLAIRRAMMTSGLDILVDRADREMTVTFQFKSYEDIQITEA